MSSAWRRLLWRNEAVSAATPSQHFPKTERSGFTPKTNFGHCICGSMLCVRFAPHHQPTLFVKSCDPPAVVRTNFKKTLFYHLI
jgi:hypothetical protein